jgi:universal stress protein A
MTSFKTIVHPTDFSSSSTAALNVARAIARAHGARLVLVHVVPYERVAGVVREMLTELETSREELETLRQRVDGPDLKFPVEGHLRRGLAPEEILEAAAETSADLIVIGTHGRTGLKRLLLGSVAESVLRGAPCPVISVKTPEQKPARIESGDRHGTIVV